MPGKTPENLTSRMKIIFDLTAMVVLSYKSCTKSVQTICKGEYLSGREVKA